MHTFAKKPKATQQNTSAKSPKPSRAFRGQSPDVRSPLYLQRTIGNQATQRLLQAEPEDLEASSASKMSRGFAHDFSRIPVHDASSRRQVQFELKVSEPGDQYEQEADRVADQVMRVQDASVGGRASAPNISRLPAISPAMQRQTENEEEEEMLQAKSADGSGASLSAGADTLVGRAQQGSGQPLPDAVRARMEPAFGVDFSAVRLHAGGDAAAAAGALQARAFTIGNDIVFGAGEKQLDTPAGQHLLAHELTHVVHQGGVRAPIRDRLRASSSPYPTIQRTPDQPQHGAALTLPAQVNLGTQDPESFIRDEIDDFKDVHIPKYFQDYRDGLDLFRDAMTFSSDQEADANYASAVFNAVAKEAFKKTVEAALENNPAVKSTVGILITGVEAAVNEHDRARSASGQVMIREYIGSIIDDIGGLENDAVDAADAWEDDVIAQYRDLTGQSDDWTSLHDGWLTGPGAEFILDLQRFMDPLFGVVGELRQYDARFFELQIAERFAILGGPTRSVLGATVDTHRHAGGFLYLRTRIMEDDGDLEVQSVEDNWTLVTAASNPARIAQALKDAHQSVGRPIHRSNLKKVVAVEIEHEVFGFNEYSHGELQFDSISDVTFVPSRPGMFNPRPTTDDEALFLRAWRLLRDRVARASGLQGNDTATALERGG